MTIKKTFDNKHMVVIFGSDDHKHVGISTMKRYEPDDVSTLKGGRQSMCLHKSHPLYKTGLAGLEMFIIRPIKVIHML